MKKITLCSWKGGTGKTTLTAAAIKTLANQGYKILVIDLDSNLSMTRAFNAVGKSGTSIDLLNGDAVQPHETFVKNVDIIPSNLRISTMANLSERVLKTRLKKMDLSKYDYVFIDPPGTMNSLTRNAICTADKVIIPSMPSDIDYEATGLVIEEMEMMGVEADVSIVLNGFDAKRNLNNIKNQFIETYDELFYQPPVSAMKSLKNLTANISKYQLTGRAKEIIDRFVLEVVA